MTAQEIRGRSENTELCRHPLISYFQLSISYLEIYVAVGWSDPALFEKTENTQAEVDAKFKSTQRRPYFLKLFWPREGSKFI